MKSISFVNGANILGRSLITRLGKSAQKIKLLDPRPFRPAVYDMQSKLKNQNISAEFSKAQIHSKYSLQKNLQGSDAIIYINHDYYSMTSDKNDMLHITAKSAKQLGVKKFIALSPIEFDHFLEDPHDCDKDHSDVFKRRDLAEKTAMAENPDMLHMRVNLMYGQSAYALKYLIQCHLRGVIPCSYNVQTFATKFSPVHTEDIVEAVKHSLGQDVKGGRSLMLNGSEKISFKEILLAVDRSANTNKIEDSYSGQTMNLNALTNLFYRFVVGQCHDKNILSMFKYYEGKNVDFEKEYGADYIKQSGLQFSQKTFRKEFEGKLKDQDYIYPLLADYKRIQID